MPNYCFNLKRTEDNKELLPAVRNWNIDIEVEWNKMVAMGDGKIKEEKVSSIETTTDLLCSPGKYTAWDYKNHNIRNTWNNVWDGLTDIPREIFGIGLNGILLF